MLILDKSQPSSFIYPTVSREMVDVTNTICLDIKDNFSSKGYQLFFDSNISPFPQRYDKYYVDITLYENIEAGFYKYIIWEYRQATNEFVTPLETGLLEVQQAEPVAYRSLEEHQDEFPNQFKVYQNI